MFRKYVINFSKMRLCKHCNKPIVSGEASFYMGYWNKFNLKSNVFHYHVHCFNEFAGEEFADALKIEEKESKNEALRGDG